MSSKEPQIKIIPILARDLVQVKLWIVPAPELHILEELRC